MTHTIARPRTPAELKHLNWLVRTGQYPKAANVSNVAVKIIQAEKRREGKR